MDRRRFDALARALSAARSRRDAAAALVGGLLGSLPYVADPASAKNRKHKHKHKKKQKQRRKDDDVAVQGPCGDGSGPDNRCTKDSQCCTKHCDKKKRRCRCLKQGEACSTNRFCCTGRTGRTCQAGRCQPATACGHACASGCPFTRIQDAIDDASEGDTIRLCAEHYGEFIIIDKDLTLVGAGDGEDGTILDSQGNGGTLAVFDGNTVALEHLRITGGDQTLSAGGIRNLGVLVVTACTVTGNTGELGGGIFNFGRLTLIDTRVIDNTADFGGGIRNDSGTVTLENCTVSGNIATEPGGGISNLGSLTLVDSQVTDNHSTSGSGGGIVNTLESGITSTLELTNSTVSGNSAALSGGGIFNEAALTLTDSHVTDNEAEDGGGIFNDGAGTVDLNGTSSVSGNRPDDCVGVPPGVCGTS